MKNLPTLTEDGGGKPIKDEGKNRQIEINEKSPNPVGTEEENRFASGESRLLRLRLLVLSAGGLSTTFLFGSFGKRSHRRPSHWKSGVGRKRSGC